MRKFVRWLVPAVVALVWLGASGFGGPFFGKLSDVQSQDNTDFLPASAESTRALELQSAFDDASAPPAIVVFEGVDGVGIDAAAANELRALMREVGELEGVGGASPPLPSAEQDATGAPLAYQAFVVIEGDTADVVANVRETLSARPEGVTGFVTGPAGFVADLVEAFGEIDGILLLVTVLAVLVILLFVYRSPVLPLVVLLAAVGALAVSVVAVYLMADAGWIRLSGQTQGILFILVIGAATDYSLLLVARFREALREHASPGAAMRVAWRGTVEPILASGGTVIAGVLTLLASDLNSNKALGPVAAAGIVFAMASALTFLPAMLTLFGRAAFWPFRPRLDPEGVRAEERAADTVTHAPRGAQASAASSTRAGGGLWGRVAATVARRPRRVWVITTVALVAAAAFAPTFRAEGVPQSAFLLGPSESREGQAALGRHFAAGVGAPATILGDAARVDALVAAAASVEGVDSVSVRSTGGGFAGGGAATEPRVEVIDGRSWVLVEATLEAAPDSEAAIGTVRALREAVHTADASALVGGTTATDLDTRDTARADLGVIIPLVLVVITLMLMALLRSVVAPLLLVATTVLSYLSTLGVASLVFDHLFGFPGADPTVPLFGFVFLVALGIDYNIFLSSRVREEATRYGTRPGVLRGLRLTGGVITSAGIVLAATFAALAVIPILFLAQIAFIVAFGVLLDALVVRSFLVPGLLYDVGKAVWWPSRLARVDGSANVVAGPSAEATAARPPRVTGRRKGTGRRGAEGAMTGDD